MKHVKMVIDCIGPKDEKTRSTLDLGDGPYEVIIKGRYVDMAFRDVIFLLIEEK